MVKIFNPTVGPNPLATTLRNLGQQMFGDQVGGALNNEKLYAAQRENTETDNLMRRIAGGGGAQAITADPVAQAVLIGSGYDPSKFNSVARMGGATQYGAADPRTQNLQVGAGQSYDNTADAVSSKLAEVTRNNDLQSADRRYGVDQNNATDRYKFENEAKPALNAQGKPVFAPQIDLPNFQPILSDTERKGTLAGNNFGDMGSLPAPEQEYLGALPGSAGGSRGPKNYIVPGGPGAPPQTYVTSDGVTDLQTGQPLPKGGYIGTVQGGAGDVGLTNSVTTNLQNAVINADKFIGLADAMDKLAASNPASFGLVGSVRSKAQEAMQAFSAVNSMMGGQATQYAQAARKDLDQKGLGGLVPELYDPSLPAVDMLGGLLLYNGAATLAGQENRSVSDQDIQNMRKILGDPQSMWESAASIRTKIGLAKAVVSEHKRLAQEYLKTGRPVPKDGSLVAEAVARVVAQSGGAPNAAPAPITNPQPAAQGGADPLAQARDAIARGADRNAVIQRLQSMGVDTGGL